MTYRKTRLSYVIWLLYTCLCVMLLAFVGYSVYDAYVKAAPAKLGALLVFPLLFCIYPALKKSALTLRKKHSISAHSKQMIEALCVSVAFVFGFLVRLRMFRYADALLSSGETLGGGFWKKLLCGQERASNRLRTGSAICMFSCFRRFFFFGKQHRGGNVFADRAAAFFHACSLSTDEGGSRAVRVLPDPSFDGVFTGLCGKDR